MKQFSIEHRRKLSEAAKKRWKDPEYRKEMAQVEMSKATRTAMSERMKSIWADPEYRKQHTGVKASEEKKRKISEKAKKRWADPEYKARVSETMKDSIAERGCSEETRAKLSRAVKKRVEDPAYRKRLSESSKKKWQNPEYRKRMLKAREGLQTGENHPMWGKHPSEASRKKMSESHVGIQAGENHPMYGNHHSEVTRKQMSKSHVEVPLSKKHRASIGKASKKVWATIDEEKKNEWQGNIRKALACSPNKPEQAIFSILNSLYPGEWKFVGDGQLIIAGKCPDFVNVNGRKQLIECFGTYWHRGEDPQDRIDIFKPYGYETLVIWEHELKDIDLVVNKIKDFTEL